MKKLFFIGLILMLLIGGVYSYTAPSFEGQPIIVESSSNFYGSSTGFVTIDLNLTAIDDDFKDFFIRITGLDDTNTIVNEITFNKEKIKTLSYPIYETSKTKINQKLMDKTPLEIVLEFDPDEIGLGREFDIQLVTKEGLIIADLDPFLSGWDYRQEWTLDTNGISLSGNVTNDHAILFSKTSSDTGFWANTNSDGNDVRFTDSSNNEFDYYLEEWTDDTSMSAWVEVTETFDATTDVTGYMYYGNSGASDDQNQNGTFPSTYKAVYLFDEGSGTTANDSTTGGNNLTGLPNDWVSGETSTAINFDGGEKGTTASNLGLSATDFTYYLWVNRSGATNGGFLKVGGGSGGAFGIGGSTMDDAGNDLIYLWEGAGWRDSGASVGTGWQQVAITHDSSNNLLFYINGSLETTSSIGAPTFTASTQVGGSDSRYVDASIDNLKFFSDALDGDEIKLLYSSESGNLVSFGSQASSNNVPDVNVTSPTLDLNWSGSHSITFDFSDLDATNTFDVNLFYSDTAGGSDNLIVHDSNLADGSGITCDDYNFTDSTSCSYSWDTTTASDGVYYIDANVSDGFEKDGDSSPQFRVDNTDPVTTFSGCNAGWHNTTQTITLSCADTDGSGCNGTTYSIDDGEILAYSGTFDIDSDGNHYIDYNSIDYATNEEVTKRNYCAYDLTPPTVQSPVFDGFTIFGNFIKGLGTILGGLAEDILSGIDQATCEYTINGGVDWISAVWDTDHCKITNITINDGQDYNIGTRVDDVAGNTGTSDFNGIYTGDTTAPTTNDDASNDWTNADQTVTLSPSDASGSGVANTYYCVDTLGSCTPETIGTNVSVTCSADTVCLQYVRYFSQDNLDNNESVQDSVLTRIDKEKPVTTKEGCLAGWNNTDQDINFNCTDSSGSGCNDTKVQIDGGGWNILTETTISTDGNHLIEYYSDDVVGNTEETSSFYCMVDKTAPTYSSIDGNNVLQTAPFYLNVNGLDFDVSGKSTAQYRIDAGSWENFVTDYNIYFDVDGNYLVDFNFIDNANNSLSINDVEANLLTAVIFSDFNLFKWDDFSQNFDITSVSDSNFIFDFNIDYADFNIDSVFANYSLSGDDDQNCYGSLRGVERCGWRTGTDFITWSIYENTDDLYNVRSSTVETNAYTRTATNVPVKLLYPATDNYVLNNSQDWIKTFFNGVGVDKNTYYHFHNNAEYVGIGSRLLNIYDCNNNSSNPSIDAGCFLESFDSTDSGDTAIDYYSNDANQIADVNIPLNVDGNHWVFWNCPSCNNAKYWEVDSVDENSNIDMDRHFISSTGLTGFASESTTSTNGYFHWLNLTRSHSFNWFITANDTNSVTQTEVINLVNIAPNINSFKTLEQTGSGDSYDVNIVVSDAYIGVVEDGLVCDLNIFDESDNEYSVFTNVSPVLNGAWVCSFDVNTLDYTDGNYYFKGIVRETTTDENYSDTLTRTEPVTFDNDAPIIIVVYPNGNEYFADPTSISIDFNISGGVSIDLNYSGSNVQGTGTPVLIEESIEGALILCDGVECSYSWDASGVVDGNYFILITAYDSLYSSFDVSDNDFNIYTTPPVEPTGESVYTERYINPASNQRDDNRYYNPTSLFNLSADEKQTAELSQMNNFLLYFGVIIIGILIICGVILWKKR